MPKHAFLCGLSQTQRTSAQDGQVLSLAQGSGNLNLRLDDLRKRLVGSEPKRLTDLIEIASYVFAADRTTKRGTEILKNYGESWRREFLMVVAVREPAFWNQAEVKEALSAALAFASEDIWSFDFTENQHPASLQSYLGLREEQIDSAGGTSVILFSGGLDSLAGAVEELTTSNRQVVLVSHRNTPAVGALQKELASKLSAAFPRRVTHVWVDNSLSGLDDREQTQRTRSFFFVAVAAVAAHIERADRIRLFENGVMSVNLPIATQVVGARASRSTHPRTVLLLQQVINLVSAHDIEVGNPFIWQTKAEVVAQLVGSTFGSLITRSFSCTRSRHGASAYARHCGTCVQCLQRRLSTLGGNAAAYDEAEGYEVDLFLDAREDTPDRVMAFGTIQLALDCAAMSDLEFMGRFALEVSQVAQAYPLVERDGVAQKLMDLFRRHGQTVRSISIDAVRTHASRLVDKAVPPGSILALLSTQNFLESRHSRQGLLEPVAKPALAQNAEQPAPPPPEQIAVAVDTDRKQIRVFGIAPLSGKTVYAILAQLIAMSSEDRAAQLARKNYRCKRGKVLADELDLSDAEAVAQAVRRIRKEIAEGFEALEDRRLSEDAVIENDGRGYRLNPSVIILTLAEFNRL